MLENKNGLKAVIANSSVRSQKNQKKNEPKVRRIQKEIIRLRTEIN